METASQRAALSGAGHRGTHGSSQPPPIRASIGVVSQGLVPETQGRLTLLVSKELVENIPSQTELNKRGERREGKLQM